MHLILLFAMICFLIGGWWYCRKKQNIMVQSDKKLGRRLYTVQDRVSGAQLVVGMTDDFAIIL